ncbi:MAG: YegP family protein [Pyrinomonadaceae bacterium]
MPGKFVVKTAKNGKVHFNLKATNGQIILTSESYETRASALKGIESVKKNAANAGRFERKMGKDGSPYFVLKASNGEPLGRSEMYKRASSMESGITSVAKNAPDSPVVDE